MLRIPILQFQYKENVFLTKANGQKSPKTFKK